MGPWKVTCSWSCSFRGPGDPTPLFSETTQAASRCWSFGHCSLGSLSKEGCGAGERSSLRSHPTLSAHEFIKKGSWGGMEIKTELHGPKPEIPGTQVPHPLINLFLHHSLEPSSQGYCFQAL